MNKKSIIKNIKNNKYIRRIYALGGSTPYYELTDKFEDATIFNSCNYEDKIRLKEAYLSEDYELIPVNDQIFF